MAKNSYKPDKRRRELDRKAKQEAKRKRRQNKSSGTASGNSEDSPEDTSYLEYLNPAGMMDVEDDSEPEDEEQTED